MTAPDKEGLFDRPSSAYEFRFKVSARESDAVRACAKARKVKVSDVILDALRAERRAVEGGADPTPEQSALFERPEPKKLLSVYLTDAERAWIDAQASRNDATRTDVVVAALRRYFAPKPDDDDDERG